MTTELERDAIAAEVDQAAVVRKEAAANAAAAARKLADDKGFAPAIVAILDRHTHDPATIETYGQIAAALAEVADDAVADFILQSITVDNLEVALDDLKPELPKTRAASTSLAELTSWLTLLRAHFSTSIRDAQLKWRQDPDDWMFIQREALRDYLREAWAIRFTITKYNGERFALAGTPNTAINLIRELLMLLTAFPDSSGFGEAELQGMATAIREFDEKFFGTPEAAIAAALDTAGVDEPAEAATTSAGSGRSKAKA